MVGLSFEPKLKVREQYYNRMFFLLSFVSRLKRRQIFYIPFYAP